MYTVTIFDGAKRGKPVARVYDATACAVLVSVLGKHATVRCGTRTCDWLVWDANDTIEYPDASYDDLARMLDVRISAHWHDVHSEVEP